MIGNYFFFFSLWWCIGGGWPVTKRGQRDLDWKGWKGLKGPEKAQSEPTQAHWAWRSPSQRAQTVSGTTAALLPSRLLCYAQAGHTMWGLVGHLKAQLMWSRHVMSRGEEVGWGVNRVAGGIWLGPKVLANCGSVWLDYHVYFYPLTFTGISHPGSYIWAGFLSWRSSSFTILVQLPKSQTSNRKTGVRPLPSTLCPELPRAKSKFLVTIYLVIIFCAYDLL